MLQSDSVQMLDYISLLKYYEYCESDREHYIRSEVTRGFIHTILMQSLFSTYMPFI